MPDIKPEDERDALIAYLSSCVSWGYVRAGNAYADRSKPSPAKPRVEAIDIAKEQSPNG